MYCYSSVHFNEISENRKTKIITKIKNQNGTHHAVFVYNKFQA
jgi:hypothetical protein